MPRRERAAHKVPFKAYIQEALKAAHGDYATHLLGALIWHLVWTAVCLTGLIAFLFMPTTLYSLLAVVVMTLPGILSIVCLSKDAGWMRQILLFAWAGCALAAVTLTGGITGPLSLWLIMPIAAGVTLNRRQAMTLGGALAFGIALPAAGVSLLALTPPPQGAEAFGLALMAALTAILALAAAVMPAFRARTERAHAAEEARARLLAMLIEQPQLALRLEPSGKVVSAYGETPAGLELTHLLREGLAATAQLSDREKVQAAIESAQSQGRSEVGFVPKAALDHYVWLSLRKGSDEGLYGVLIDLSLVHAHQAALETARAEAELHSRGKSQFLASMSHELRTPLNAVLGFSDIMRQQMFGPLSDKYTEYAQLIWESGQHVLEMINDVLDVSKIEAQKYELTYESFDMREPVSQALRLIRAAAHDKEVEVKSLLKANPLTVTADRRAIKQITLNLLSNAVKFTPKGGQIVLSLTQVNGEAEILISDTGVGIATEDLNRIGQPYEQSGTAEQRAMGTGLGLSIVKSLVSLHGGTLSLFSTIGEGTRVQVRLPVANQPELPLEGRMDAPTGPAVTGPEVQGDFAEFAVRPRQG